jgi:VWFA-related protein
MLTRLLTTRCSLLPLLAVLSASVCVAAAQRPAFRSAVELVLLNVTVTGPGQQFVTDLASEDFIISEEGRQQELAFFSPARTPLLVSLLVDTSSSMEEQMPQARQAALDFVAKLRPGDVAEVVSFDSRVEVLQQLTDDRKLLQEAIGRLRAGGSTALYNAIYIALNQQSKMRPASTDDIRRQVIVVLSDGEDTSSLVTYEQLLDTAKRSQTVIYGIGLGLEEDVAKRKEGEFALRELAKETGGRVFLPKRSEDLADVYTQVANELANQYVLGFLSTNHGSGWRRLVVQVRRPNMQVRTRAGYYADSP